MATTVQAARFRTANNRLVTFAQRDLARFWDRLDLNRPALVRDALVEFVPTLTDTYGDAAAVVAADFYDDLRQLEQAPGRFRAEPAPTVPAEQVQARTRFGAQHLWSAYPIQTLRFLDGAVAKWVLTPGRDTIVTATAADPAATGWHRETRPSRAYASGCDFCRMLAGRGGVYKKAAAPFAAHDDCKCVAVPSWDPHAREVPAEAYVASARTSAMSPEDRAYYNRQVRDWIAEHAS